MFWLIKQVFIALMGFRVSLVTKYVSLNNGQRKNGLTIIDLNHVGINIFRS